MHSWSRFALKIEYRFLKPFKINKKYQNARCCRQRAKIKKGATYCNRMWPWHYIKSKLVKIGRFVFWQSFKTIWNQWKKIQWPLTALESENQKKGQRVAIDYGPTFNINSTLLKIDVSYFQNSKIKLVPSGDSPLKKVTLVNCLESEDGLRFG